MNLSNLSCNDNIDYFSKKGLVIVDLKKLTLLYGPNMNIKQISVIPKKGIVQKVSRLKPIKYYRTLFFQVFVTVFKGRAKSFNLTKLKTSTFYRFRLIAINELGRSQPSEVVTFATQGSAPPQPQPPGLKEATKSSLHLVNFFNNF